MIMLTRSSEKIFNPIRYSGGKQLKNFSNVTKDVEQAFNEVKFLINFFDDATELCFTAAQVGSIAV